MAKSLLEQAAATPIRSQFDPAQLEVVAVAWVTGKLTTSQVQKTLNRSGSALYGLVAVALRRAIMAGRIKLQ